MRPGAGTMACLLRWGAEEMLAQGHVGSLLFKAAFRSFNSTSPLGPSGLILSIFSSAFVFLASEGGSPHLHDSVQLLVCIFLFFVFFFFFSWHTTSSVVRQKKFCNQEDGCLYLILELLLNTVNVPSDFI